jgi:hypothetical protein
MLTQDLCSQAVLIVQQNLWNISTYLFYEDLMNLIMTETNIYANTKQQIQTPPTKHARTAACKECSIIDIKAIIGRVINMGLHPLTDITNYASTDA